MKAAALVAFTFVLLWAALRFWGNYTESGRLDACLDQGGAWNYEQSKCEGTRSSP